MLDQLLDHLVGAAEQRKRNSQVIHTHLSHLTFKPVQKAPTVHVTVSSGEPRVNRECPIMMKQNVTDTLNTLQAMLQPTAEIRQTMRTNLEDFWNNQDQVLGSMEEFTNGWIERRHVGTQAALTAAQRMCDTKTGFDLMKEYQTWAVGSLERIMADSSALQEHLMTVAGLFTKPLTPAEKESTAKAEKESAPKAMAIRTLAASGLSQQPD
jgi:hypothetical protein